MKSQSRDVSECENAAKYLKFFPGSIFYVAVVVVIIGVLEPSWLHLPNYLDSESNTTGII